MSRLKQCIYTASAHAIRRAAIGHSPSSIVMLQVVAAPGCLPPRRAVQRRAVRLRALFAAGMPRGLNSTALWSRYGGGQSLDERGVRRAGWWEAGWGGNPTVPWFQRCARALNGSTHDGHTDEACVAKHVEEPWERRRRRRRRSRARAAPAAAGRFVTRFRRLCGGKTSFQGGWQLFDQSDSYKFVQFSRGQPSRPPRTR